MAMRFVAAVMMVALLGFAGPGVRAELAPGTTLDQSNADQASGLLPPEILKHYKGGDYINPIVDFPTGRFRWDDGFDAATQQNAERLVLDENKQPVDKTTMKRPDYLTGIPFPEHSRGRPRGRLQGAVEPGVRLLRGGQQPELDDPQLVEPHRRAAGRGPGRVLPLLRWSAEAVHAEGQPGEHALPVSRRHRVAGRHPGHRRPRLSLQGSRRSAT